MDNKTPDNKQEFKWNDELVKEFVEGAIRVQNSMPHEVSLDLGILHFKKSKEHKVEEKRIESIAIQKWYDTYGASLDKWTGEMFDEYYNSGMQIEQFRKSKLPTSLKQKTYTQSEVDAIRKETWAAARNMFRIRIPHNGLEYGDIQFKYKELSDYLSSLNPNNSEPLSDSIPTLDVNTKDKMAIKFIETDSQFLEANASCYEDWYYMPHWFQKIKHGIYKIYSLAELPKRLKEDLLQLRGEQPVPENKPQESKQDSKGYEIVEHGYIQSNGFAPDKQYISKVCRLSDGEVFSVGLNNNGKIIEKFFEGWNGMEIHYTDGSASLLLEETKLPLTEQPKPRQMWNKHTGIHDESVLCTGMKCQEYNPLNKEHKI